MTRGFIDSGEFFSAAYSSHDHSRDLILMVLGGEVDLVLSRFVLEETRRNLAEVAPKSVSFLEFILESVPYEIVRPSKMQVVKAASMGVRISSEKSSPLSFMLDGKMALLTL